MDPQKNPQNPTQNDADQQPASIQMPQDGVTPSPEVTVDFNQGAQDPATSSAQPAADATTAGLSPTGSDAGLPPVSQSSDGGFADTTAPAVPQTDATAGQPAMPAGNSAQDLGLGGGASTPQTQAQPSVDPYAAPTQPATGFPDAAAPVTQPFNPVDQAGVPPVAPVPASKADKKTVMILAGVAVILIVAIAVLFFM